MTGAVGASIDPSRIAAVDVFLGYLLSSVAAVLSLVVALLPTLLIDTPDFGAGAFLGLIGAMGMVFVTICAIAAPGFLVLRGVLWGLGRRDWPSFAVAGVLNALFAALWVWNDLSIERFLQYPPSPIVPLIGGVAGTAQCFAERYFSHWRLARAGGK